MGVTSMRHEEAVASSLISRKKFDLAFSTFADDAVLILLLDHMVIHYSI
jgi:hypothetical protein